MGGNITLPPHADHKTPKDNAHWKWGSHYYSGVHGV